MEEGLERFEHPEWYNTVTIIITLGVAFLAFFYPKVVTILLVIVFGIMDWRIKKIEMFQTKVLEGKIKKGR